jgi:predicted esterase
MRRSVLSYRQENAGNNAGFYVVALHGAGATCAQLIPLCRSLTGVAGIFAPEGPLPSSGRFGTLGAEREWYVEQEERAIEPLGFADSLRQVEQFVLDSVDDLPGHEGSQPGLYMIGLGQGGVLALTLSIIWPELLKGVVSIQGYLPEIPGWQPPQREMKELPVLLVRDAEAIGPLAGMISRSASRLACLGANVTTEDCPAARLLTPQLSASILGWIRGVEAGLSSPARPPQLG